MSPPGPVAPDAPAPVAVRLPVVQRLVTFGRDIKLSHSVFALPFALLATFLAAAHEIRLPRAAELSLIVACMVCARTVAMAVNRLADAALDARNPRTAGRAIPSGRLTRGFYGAVAGLCAAGFFAGSAGFWLINANPWPLALSLPALLWLCAYSYSKRLTWLAHLWLGSSLALAPVGAALAIAPGFLQRPEPYLLFALVSLWVAGFDVIYALQDIDVDRAQGLFSLPANLGVEPALWVSRLMHAGAAALLALLAWVSPTLGVGFATGVALVAGLLLLEHLLIRRSPQHHLHLAFFTLNGLISLLLGALGIADVLRA